MEIIDNVNHPKHYTSDASGVECIQVARHRNFNVGNAIKYLWRAGLKQDADKESIQKEIEDLNKAVWYIIDEIHRLGGKCNVETDVMDTKIPTSNKDIINSVLNYRVYIKDRPITIIGCSRNLDKTKADIQNALENIIHNELSL